MVPHRLSMLAAAVCLGGISCADQTAPPLPPEAGAAVQAFDGLWSGSWGGGDIDGVVFQPVIAEMIVQRDRIELSGFPQVGNLAGSVRFDAAAKQMLVRPQPAANDSPAAATLAYRYAIQGDLLTLTDDQGREIRLQRYAAAAKPWANVPVEFVAAEGLDAEGNLQVTEFAELRATRTGTAYYHPRLRLLKTARATAFVVEGAALKKLTLDEARERIRETTPVAIAYRQDERPTGKPPYELWREIGSPAADGVAAGRTLANLLRPGTLVFVLSAEENVPLP